MLDLPMPRFTETWPWSWWQAHVLSLTLAAPAVPGDRPRPINPGLLVNTPSPHGNAELPIREVCTRAEQALDTARDTNRSIGESVLRGTSAVREPVHVGRTQGTALPSGEPPSRSDSSHSTAKAHGCRAQGCAAPWRRATRLIARARSTACK